MVCAQACSLPIENYTSQISNVAHGPLLEWSHGRKLLFLLSKCLPQRLVQFVSKTYIAQCNEQRDITCQLGVSSTIQIYPLFHSWWQNGSYNMIRIFCRIPGDSYSVYKCKTIELYTIIFQKVSVHQLTPESQGLSLGSFMVRTVWYQIL